jgi:hypothetical protein
MSASKELLISIVVAACASIVVAGAGSDLTGSFVHRSGSDQDAVSISVTVEARADGKYLFSLMAAHPDAHGAAPDGDGEGRIGPNGVLRFAYEDSFSNKGTGTFRRTKKGYLLSIDIDHVADPRCLVFYGEHAFQRDPRKKSPAPPDQETVETGH